jgi:nucleoside-diphosphate-sugar epimerase
MKKKIVITGISSAIVKKMTEQLDLSKYDIVGITRNLSNVSLSGIKIIKGDLLNMMDYSTLLNDCYMIIHGAAITHSRKEKEYFKINLDATKKLVDAAKKYNVERFIFVSSNTAGKTSGTYGLTKFLAENYIKKKCNNWIIFRISEVYGGNKGEGIEKLLSDILTNSIVLCPTNVPSKLCPIHIKDVAQQMLHHTFLRERLNITLMINGPKAYSYSEIIDLGKKKSKRKVKVIYLSKRFMFFVKWIVKKCPFNIGIVPDQVDRLYSVKDIRPNENTLIKLEDYIDKLLTAKPKLH